MFLIVERADKIDDWPLIDIITNKNRAINANNTIKTGPLRASRDIFLGIIAPASVALNPSLSKSSCRFQLATGNWK